MEIWDRARDMRTFTGGMPVVAHPPCRSWSAFCAHQARPEPGEKELGPLCVEWLRQCGGVLEHPAHSRLWEACGLPRPTAGLWEGVWTAEVQQAWWGDTRSKRTWLAFFGIPRAVVVIPYRLHDARGDRGRWNALSKNRRAATPLPMAQWLVDVARKTHFRG